MSATGAIMVTSLVAMIVSQRLLGRVSPALVTSTVLVVAFGALTLALDDTRFIMLKPTMVYLLFAAAIGIGLLVRKPVLQLLLGDTLKLTETGWRLLSIRWAGFFVAMAVLNEIVRLSLDERAWVLFKVAGFPILTLVFVIAQARLMTEHRITDGA
jgi:intracellular septation protein